MTAAVSGGTAMSATPELCAVRWNSAPRMRLEFEYRVGRWERVEAFSPHNVREALSVALSRIEAAQPGAIASAAKLDDARWMHTRRRTRRYVAESADVIYLDSPHLRGHVVNVGGYCVPTNIARRDVVAILRLVCQAAGVPFGGVARQVPPLSWRELDTLTGPAGRGAVTVGRGNWPSGRAPATIS